MGVQFRKKKYSTLGRTSSDRLEFLKTDNLEHLIFFSPFDVGQDSPVQLGKQLRIDQANDLSRHDNHLTISHASTDVPKLRENGAQFIAADQTGLWSPSNLPYTLDLDGTIFFAGYQRDVISNGYHILLIADGVSNFYFGVEINVNDRYAWFSRNNAGLARVQGTQTFSDDELVVGALKRDGVNTVLYINGVEVASSTSSDFLWMSSYNFRVTMGGLFRTSNSDFWGTSRPMLYAYYSRVMSDEEIAWKSQKTLALPLFNPGEDIFAIVGSSSSNFSFQFNVLQSRNATFRFYNKNGDMFFSKTMGDANTVDLSWNTNNDDIFITIESNTAQLPLTSSPSFTGKTMRYFNNSLWQLSFGEANFTGQTEIETYGIEWGTSGGSWNFTTCHITDTGFFEGATQATVLRMRFQNQPLDWTLLQQYMPNLIRFEIVAGSNQPDTVVIDSWNSMSDLVLGDQFTANSALGILDLTIRGLNQAFDLQLSRVEDIETVLIDTCPGFRNLGGFTNGPSSLRNVSFIGDTNLQGCTLQDSNLTQESMDNLIRQCYNDGINTGILYFPLENGGYSDDVEELVQILKAREWTSPATSYPIHPSTTPILRNMYIGGVQNDLTTEALVASVLGISTANMYSFVVVAGEGIRFRIDTPINLPTGAFSNGGGGNDWGYGAILTHLWDPDGNINDLGFNPFQSQSNLESVIIPGATGDTTNLLDALSQVTHLNADSLVSLDGQGLIRLTIIDQLRLPSTTTITSTPFNAWSNPSQKLQKRLWIPFITDLGSGTGVFNNISSGAIIYYHPDNDTNNGGGLNQNLVQARDTFGAVLKSVTDLTPPGVITDLAALNVTGSSVDLTFTPPSSTNTLEFYQVFIDNGLVAQVQKFFAFEEISGSGETVTGLDPGTTYTIKIVACDEFWNMSDDSNEIQITTL